MAILLKIVVIVCMLVVVVMAVANTLWFNEIPEKNKYKGLQAFNVLVFWIIAVWLIVRIAMM